MSRLDTFAIAMAAAALVINCWTLLMLRRSARLLAEGVIRG